MSLKRDRAGGTPSGSRLHQAFKSPFRIKEDANDTSLQKRTPKSGIINIESNTFTPGCSEVKVEDNMKKQTPHTLYSKGTFASSLTPNRIAIDRSPHLANSCRKKIIPRRFNVPFRSPSRNLLLQQSSSPEDELAQLYKQEVELEEEITTLENLGYKVEELQGHIENLHRYNEIKDAAQLVMGRLAELDGVTIKEMHERYKVSTME